MHFSKYHKTHTRIGPNFESLPYIDLSHCLILLAGSAIKKSKRHFHGFRIQKENDLQNRQFNFVYNFFKLRQWCETGSRERASLLRDENANIV